MRDPRVDRMLEAVEAEKAVFDDRLESGRAIIWMKVQWQCAQAALGRTLETLRAIANEEPQS